MVIDAFCFRSFSGTSLGLNYSQKAGTNLPKNVEEKEEEEFDHNSIQSIDTEFIDNTQSTDTKVVNSNVFCNSSLPPK